MLHMKKIQQICLLTLVITLSVYYIAPSIVFATNDPSQPNTETKQLIYMV